MPETKPMKKKKKVTKTEKSDTKAYAPWSADPRYEGWEDWTSLEGETPVEPAVKSNTKKKRGSRRFGRKHSGRNLLKAANKKTSKARKARKEPAEHHETKDDAEAAPTKRLRAKSKGKPASAVANVASSAGSKPGFEEGKENGDAEEDGGPATFARRYPPLPPALSGKVGSASHSLQ